MQLDINLADIKTFRLVVSRCGDYRVGRITIPPDLIRRHGLKDKEEIVMCYICRSSEKGPIKES